MVCKNCDSVSPGNPTMTSVVKVISLPSVSRTSSTFSRNCVRVYPRRMFASTVSSPAWNGRLTTSQTLGRSRIASMMRLDMSFG